VLIGATLFWPAGSFADSFTLGEALEDTKLYFTAPLRWDSQDWLYLGGALLAVGASHEFDGRVRTHFTTPADSQLNGKDRNAVRDALPAVALIAGTGLYASFIGDSDGYRQLHRRFRRLSRDLVVAGGGCVQHCDQRSFDAGRRARAA